MKIKSIFLLVPLLSVLHCKTSGTKQAEVKAPPPLCDEKATPDRICDGIRYPTPYAITFEKTQGAAPTQKWCLEISNLDANNDWRYFKWTYCDLESSYKKQVFMGELNEDLIQDPEVSTVSAINVSGSPLNYIYDQKEMPVSKTEKEMVMWPRMLGVIAVPTGDATPDLLKPVAYGDIQRGSNVTKGAFKVVNIERSSLRYVGTYQKDGKTHTLDKFSTAVVFSFLYNGTQVRHACLSHNEKNGAFLIPVVEYGAGYYRYESEAIGSTTPSDFNQYSCHNADNVANIDIRSSFYYADCSNRGDDIAINKGKPVTDPQQFACLNHYNRVTYPEGVTLATSGRLEDTYKERDAIRWVMGHEWSGENYCWAQKASACEASVKKATPVPGDSAKCTCTVAPSFPADLGFWR